MLEESKEHQDRSRNIIDNKFYSAIMDEDLECIEDLSKRYGSNSPFKIQDSSTEQVFWKDLATIPLHLAATYRRVKSLQSLLSAGADPEIRDRLGRTTLHLVITAWPSVLTNRPKPGPKFKTTETCLQTQAEACLRLLCEHSINVNAEVRGEDSQTALHLSVRYTAVSAVRILTSYGAGVNAVNSGGMTPLHMAAGILHKDITASLIKAGADINMRVKQSGNTPLHLAVVAVAVKAGKTPKDDHCCVTELLKHGAEPNAVNNAGMTSLHEACSMGNEELVDLLLRYGANVNKLSKAGENCLFLYLDHRPNVRNSSLLVKLLGLTSPLTVYNHKGHLPSTLTLPGFFKQRERLLELAQQPRRLQDICKNVIYLKHVHDRREEFRKILPERLYDFVFNFWPHLDL